jgi:protein-disulfide reductase (glutathione)
VQAEGKPAMVLITKTWCGACKRLKTVFADSKAIEEGAKAFVAINLQDDEEPTREDFRPDGQYIPRLLFVTPQGVVMDIVNAGGNPKFKYYYADEASIVTSMKAASGK